MIDYFALLKFPRTPWLGSAAVQARFLELSAGAHPDRVHNLGATEIVEANERFAELNKAFAVLRDHKERLHHLIALETGRAPAMAQNIPSGFFELSSQIGLVCKSADTLVENLRKAKSPMVQAQMFEQSLNQTERIQELQKMVAAEKAKAETELQAIAANWAKEKLFERLKELAHAFAMIGKWEGQLQERFAALAAAG
jgi:curved DNA-binding protein CbpA